MWVRNTVGQKWHRVTTDRGDGSGESACGRPLTITDDPKLRLIVPPPINDACSRCAASSGAPWLDPPPEPPEAEPDPPGITLPEPDPPGITSEPPELEPEPDPYPSPRRRDTYADTHKPAGKPASWWDRWPREPQK
jgi:hypothetical protein